MHRLHVPTRTDELGGEPVEQLRVRGPLTTHSEILRGLHQSNAEVQLPVAIHRDARGEGVVGVDEPPRQPQSVPRSFLRQRYYDLRLDPSEQHKQEWPPESQLTPGARALLAHIEADEDLGRPQPRRLVERGERIRAPNVPAGIAPGVSEHDLEQLRALGYVQ